jgi:lipoprotein-releasing system permease protein
MLGVAGTVLGTLAGLVLAANVETIVPWLEMTFNFKIMPGDVFYVTEVPSEIQTMDIVTVPLFALLISVLATLFPSRRAASVEPAEALRYE